MKQVIFITGASQGLGKALATVLAENGSSVVLGDIQKEKADSVAAQIQKEGGEATAYKLDVTNEASIASVIKDVMGKKQHIDVLINNAGIDITKSFLDISPAEWNSVINVNLRGPYLMSKAVFPYMTEQKKGHIINIVSTAAKRAWKHASAYHASKWGLLGFSHALFTEARDFNVKVTAVIAGGMKTPFLLDRFADIDVKTLQDPIHVAKTVQFILTQPEETTIPEVMVLPLFETSWP